MWLRFFLSFVFSLVFAVLSVRDFVRSGKIERKDAPLGLVVFTSLFLMFTFPLFLAGELLLVAGLLVFVMLFTWLGMLVENLA